MEALYVPDFGVSYSRQLAKAGTNVLFSTRQLLPLVKGQDVQTGFGPFCDSSELSDFSEFG